MTRAHAELRTQLQDQWIRAIVREEIAAALRALAREADHQDEYETPEITSRALSAIGEAAEGAAKRITCEHEFTSAWGPRCARCGEPEPEPVNPFEEAPEGRTRACPVDQARCAPLVGWEAFCAHVYEVHTEGEEAHRIKQADRLVKGWKIND